MPSTTAIPAWSQTPDGRSEILVTHSSHGPSASSVPSLPPPMNFGAFSVGLYPVRKSSPPAPTSQRVAEFGFHFV